MRLIGAVLLEPKHEGQLQHCYMQTKALAKQTPALIDAVPPQISIVPA